MSTALNFKSKLQAVARSRHPRIRVALAAASVMFALFYLIAVIFLRQAVLQDPDTLLHVSVGRWILNNGRFPVFDTFSHTASGKVWRATDWISEVALALLYRWGGWSAVSQAVSASIGLMAGILGFCLAKRLRLSVAIGLTAIILMETSPHFLARPVVFSYPILLIWVLVILDIYDRNRWCDSYSYILIPIMMFWANLYAGFTLGLAIFYLFLTDAIFATYRNKDIRSIKKQLVLGVGVSIACIITPYGAFSALKTLQLLTISQLSHIQEWAPPNFQQDPFPLVLIVGVFVLVLYFGIRMRGARLLTFVLMTVLALEHGRGVLLFALVVPLLMVAPLSEAIPWARATANVADPAVVFAARQSVTIFGICAMLVVFVGLGASMLAPRITLPNRVAPISAIDAAKSAGLHGNVFNSYKFGGYLVLKGLHPFIDGRVALYGNNFLKEYWAAIKAQDPNDALQFLHRYGVQWALLEPKEPIVYVLQADGWKPIYKSNDAIVLAKHD